MKVTAIIKTFERPKFLQRLVDSIREFYPKLPILIADDSRQVTAVTGPGISIHRMPYDSGLSAGRNLLLDVTKTPYFLLLDDDFVFTAETKIGKFIKLLDTTDLDLVGGRVFNCPNGFFNFTGLLDHTPKGYRVHRDRFHEKHKDYSVCDIIPNFFLGRTKAVRNLRWDEELKLAEHMEFFVRARGVLKVGWCPEVVVNHDRRNAPPEYVLMRGRGSHFGHVYARKYGFPVRHQRQHNGPKSVTPVAVRRR